MSFSCASDKLISLGNFAMWLLAFGGGILSWLLVCLLLQWDQTSGGTTFVTFLFCTYLLEGIQIIFIFFFACCLCPNLSDYESAENLGFLFQTYPEFQGSNIKCSLIGEIHNVTEFWLNFWIQKPHNTRLVQWRGGQWPMNFVC